MSPTGPSSHWLECRALRVWVGSESDSLGWGEKYWCILQEVRTSTSLGRNISITCTQVEVV